MLDLSGPYQVAYDRVLPHAHQVADPFHVIRLANRGVDLVRRRVQNETLGQRRRCRRSALSDTAVVDHGI